MGTGFPSGRAARSATVREDWLAWLPEGTDRLFDDTCGGLEVSYAILSVTLNEALTLCQENRLLPAQEQAVVFAELFDRLAVRVRGVLDALEEHGRRFGTLPNVAPLRTDYFRSERAQRVARTSYLLSRLAFRGRPLFFHKLGAIGEVMAGLQKQVQHRVTEMAQQTRVSALDHWKYLEVLHYDLNTCLRETIVVLKSFCCALPAEESVLFRCRLHS